MSVGEHEPPIGGRSLANHPDLVVGRIEQLTTEGHRPIDLFRSATVRSGNCAECGGPRHEGPCTEEGGFACPKCGARGGDDWSQCRGECPMVMSPHFRTEAAERHYGSPRAGRPGGRVYDRSEYVAEDRHPMTDAPCEFTNVVDLGGRPITDLRGRPYSEVREEARAGVRVDARSPTEVLLLMWAIRRRTDGLYLPDIPKGHRNGASFLEPTFACEESPPRLFKSETAAKIALRSWLKGHHRCIHSVPMTFDGHEADPEIEIRPVAGRRAEDMEVVPVRMTMPPYP